MKNYQEWKDSFKLFKSQKKQAEKQPEVGLENRFKLTCPFCKTPTIEKRLDSSYYPKAVDVYQCTKCFKYWNNDKLNPKDAKKAVGLIENNLYTLYVAGLISQEVYLEQKKA